MHRYTRRVAVVVHACDRYQFLYKGFEYFFQEYWDFDIQCSYYFATEELNVKVAGFQNVKSGKAIWSDRLRFLLTQKVKEDYVLYMQEDMWLDKKVSKAFFHELFEKVIDNQWKQVKLHSAKVYRTSSTCHFIQNLNVAKVDKEVSDFLMSHQITLWDKEFLLKQLERHEHPWRNERRATRRMRYNNIPILHIDYFAENGSTAINHNRQIAKRSRYYSVSINGTLNVHIESFVFILMSGNCEERAYGKRLLDIYEQQLLHDRKPRPRKVDIFKRIKIWFSRQLIFNKPKTL